MKTTLFICLLAIALTVGSHASAACYADYKAKQNDPLRLHYGVAEISGTCSKSEATAQLKQRLSRNGWTLLNVVGVFGAEGLDGRKANAGAYFLRY